jgi:hypothetical protein
VNENDLRDLLPGERSLPPSRRRDMQERLTARIQQEEKASRNHFRLIVAAAAALLIAGVGTAAVLAGTNEDAEKAPVMSPAPVDRSVPDPEEVARAMDGSGIDYGINAERLLCFTLDPPENWGFEAPGWLNTQVDLTVGTEPSLGSDPVTVDLMADVCATSLRNYLGDQAAPVDHEVCVRDAERPMAVVALNASCADADGDLVRPGEGEVRPITDADIAEINHMRAVEYALLAPMQECPSAGQVDDWVHEVLTQESLDLEVSIDTGGIPDPPSDFDAPPPVCPRYAHVDWEAGVVSIEPFRS